MKIKTKLTLLIGGGMMLLSILFIFAGTVFSIHEALLIKKHKLKIAARRINVLIKETAEDKRIRLIHSIEQGLLFTEKESNLNVVIFNSDGNIFYKSSESKSVQIFKKNEYPEEVEGYKNHYHWLKWNYWKVDFFFKGDDCFIRMSLIQRLEIHEDIFTFFLGALFVCIILSLLGGRIITASIIKRASRIEKAAQMIARGNLHYRIPPSNTNDELQRLENNLNNAFAELEDSFSKVMQFSSDIAHELRTPLTIITGEIDVALAEERSTGEYQILMSNILEEVRLLRKIVDDMLILVKPQSAYSSIKGEDIDLSAMLGDLISTYTMIGDAKNIKITSEIQPDLHKEGIKSMIYLIFSNLIYNAIKYTQENGAITITLKKNSSIFFTISDNGPGIPKEEQDKIFTRFYRLKSEDSRGSGLGLAIVKKACDVSNAKITLESAPGRGSTFTVILL